MRATALWSASAVASITAQTSHIWFYTPVRRGDCLTAGTWCHTRRWRKEGLVEPAQRNASGLWMAELGGSLGNRVTRYQEWLDCAAYCFMNSSCRCFISCGVRSSLWVAIVH